MFSKFILVLALWSALGIADASVRSEYEVKAAFLYNFTRFITWSDPQAGLPGLRVCVFGQDPFGDVLQQLNGRFSQGKALELVYPESLSEVDSCQVLFIGSAKAGELSAITDYAHDRHILTVSEIPDFAEKGGIIGYVKRGNVIRFEINLQAAQRADLHINSRLLELAARVIR